MMALSYSILNNLNFQVNPGEFVGIVGISGAGKSTLLKILSKVTGPTKGKITVTGRLASLLEVGTGFHPDLTGKENIFLNGAIMGMSKREIQSKLDEIIEFSGVERYIDTPVKRYSSGMYVRLAFAVAAHLEPEILIIDEVLAVGDAEFQRKCLGKMKDVATEGRTVLFVSHNMTAIKSLCTSAIYLLNGSVYSRGDANKVVNEYLAKEAKKLHLIEKEEENNNTGNELVRLKLARINPGEGTKNIIDVNMSIDIQFEFWNYIEHDEISLSMHLYDIKGECIFNIGTSATIVSQGIITGNTTIPRNFLNDGSYYISIMVVKDKSSVVYNFQEVLHFEVEDSRADSSWYGKWAGVVRPTFIPFEISNSHD
ncbi:MAG: ABC transporter ATP-binding protein [Bacteroidetes bacterium]|nr:MAG: ABC transporter ATP-binding protein [Bacteroidota bacterium]